MYPMDTRLDQSTRKSSQSIACVDRDSSILRSNPLPIPLGVKNLQGGHWLPEEQCDCSQIRVTGTIQASNFLVFLGAASCIVHVAQMVFSTDIILVIANQLFFIIKLEENGE